MFKDLIKESLLRLLINFMSLFVAISLVKGINVEPDSTLTILKISLLFSVINLIARPLILLLSLPLLETLGFIFVLIINTIVIYLTAWLNPSLKISNFKSAIMAISIMAVSNYLINLFKPKEN